MPLPTPASRSLKHTRRVICEGYKRDDGLWDIEAHLIDTKTFSMNFRDRENGVIPAGEPLHGMAIRITVDMELNILDAASSMDYTPFNCCKMIAPAYRKLIGLQIASGFTRKTREMFSGTQGCTHLLELLGPLATTAFQATHQEREAQQNFWQDKDTPPPMLDTCHTMASDGPIVREYWPHFHAQDAELAIIQHELSDSDCTTENA